MFGFKKKQSNESIKEGVITALRGVFDPEIPVNIYDLGLIYDIAVNDEGHVHIQMTLTTRGACGANLSRYGGAGSQSG